MVVMMTVIIMATTIMIVNIYLFMCYRVSMNMKLQKKKHPERKKKHTTSGK